MKSSKRELVIFCKEELSRRENEIIDQLAALKADVMSETKSSAGDKHETSRAMINLEQEKLGRQHQEVISLKEQFDKINFCNGHNTIQKGSLVITDKGIFLLSIALGKITVEDNDFILISNTSPIGNLLIGKQLGDVIHLNSNTFVIIGLQ